MFLFSSPNHNEDKKSPITGHIIHKTRTYLGLYHGRSLSSQLLDRLEDIHHTLTLQSLYQNTEGAEYSCSTNPSTGQGKETALETPQAKPIGILASTAAFIVHYSQ